MTCGIYCIWTPTREQYIGKSNDIEARWAQHRSNLRASDHHSFVLQRAWEKYGEALEFEILQICEEHDLGKIEYELVQRLMPLLNVAKIGRQHCDDFVPLYHHDHAVIKVRASMAQSDFFVGHQHCRELDDSPVDEFLKGRWRCTECGEQILWSRLTAWPTVKPIKVALIKHRSDDPFLRGYRP